MTHWRLVVAVSCLILIGSLLGLVGLLLVSLAYQGTILWHEILYLAKAALVWTINRFQIKVGSISGFFYVVIQLITYLRKKNKYKCPFLFFGFLFCVVNFLHRYALN
jgi:hypothetical protein